MACYPIVDKYKNIIGFACTRGKKSDDEDGIIELESCENCEAIFTEYQCDFKLDNGQICDKILCQRCAYEIENDNHLCPEHKKIFEEKHGVLVFGGRFR